MPSRKQIDRFNKYVRAVESTLDDLRDAIENEEWDSVNDDAHRLATDAAEVRQRVRDLEDEDDAQ